MDSMELFKFLTHLILVTLLGWYLITNLQWYNYKIERVILKHHKYWWHIAYFLVPFFAYYLTGDFFPIFFYFALLPAFLLWNKSLDKRLVLTWRVKRFFALLVVLTLFQDFLCHVTLTCSFYGLFMPLFVATIGSMGIEKLLFNIYKNQAKKRLESIPNLQIIAITGSYGKTSIKNFLSQVLSHKYNVHATPRSVNTLGGIIKDINENLSDNCDIYIVEAGARQSGDIFQISNLLNHHYAVIGKIGPQHIEYFKNVENIIKTKMELMHSGRLKRAFVHVSATREPHERVTHFGDEILNLNATLEGTSFSLKFDDKRYEFETKILGGFQSTNILAALLVAKELGVDIGNIREYIRTLTPVAHRLERIDAGGKIILDDGYNGNIDGMLEAIAVSSLHDGRKVIVTPGLVESSDEHNLRLINAINEKFDLAIITGSLNSALFDKNLNVPQKIVLKDKRQLESYLQQFTQKGDLILFANDAPNFI